MNNDNEFLLYIYGIYCNDALQHVYPELCRTEKREAIYIENYGTINTNEIKDLIHLHEKKIPNLLQENILINDNTSQEIFLRGILDCYSLIDIDKTDDLKCCFSIDNKYLHYIEVAYHTENIKDDCLTIAIRGCNTIELLAMLYKNAKYYIEKNYNAYEYILNRNVTSKTKKFNYFKTNSAAVAPTKNRISDSGFDLYIVEKKSQKKNVYMYDTCLIVQPPVGIYFDLVPRSSIIKKGYMLANSIGIIDQSFTGSIKVALIKIDPDADELELPLKIVQIIPRQVIQIEANEVKNNEDIIVTVRGSGEYGSSDKLSK